MRKKPNIKVKIINGPNINFLGIRETDKYGKKNINYLRKIIYKKKKTYFFQSNNEYKIIKEIQKSYKNINYIIINPAGFTYNSFSILDSLLAVNIPFIEIHISNIFKREKERKKSIFSKYSSGFISGIGIYAYELALEYIFKFLT
ncbi:MAG: type II 3-dehydroquinate dehydratase [Candidatus Vidania fulgoroideorum]